jgi:hypothetical protein
MSKITKREFLRKSIFGILSFAFLSNGILGFIGLGKTEQTPKKGFGSNGYGA